MHLNAKRQRLWVRRNLPPLAMIGCCFAGMYVCSAPLRQSKTAARQAEAVRNAREIAIAEVTFQAREGRLADLAELANTGMVASELAWPRGYRSYSFRVDLDPTGERFMVHALPPTGWPEYAFYSIDEFGRMRVSRESEADRSVAVYSVP